MPSLNLTLIYVYVYVWIYSHLILQSSYEPSNLDGQVLISTGSDTYKEGESDSSGSDAVISGKKKKRRVLFSKNQTHELEQRCDDFKETYDILIKCKNANEYTYAHIQTHTRMLAYTTTNPYIYIYIYIFIYIYIYL